MTAIMAPPGIAPRLPATVMRLSRLGCAHPTRLSFLRGLLRRVTREGWRFDRALWEVDGNGVGRAVYRMRGPERTYSLVCFAHDLPDAMRSDRVIATAWDATFALHDGEPDAAMLDRLAVNVPLQEAGRVGPRELTLSRANRSVRLFEHVVASLAQGAQPDAEALDAVGYLMRTTAVYGSGKFGAADRDSVKDRAELAAPFQAEMLTVWLIRQFTVDLVEHLARARGGEHAARLDPALRRRLGVGNSTGLGMAPFLVRHPALLHRWMDARETALARVRAQHNVTPDALDGFHTALEAARRNARLWSSEHPAQQQKLSDLRSDLAALADRLTAWPGADPLPWDALWRWGEDALTEEGQEALLSLMLEPHGALVDDLADAMSVDEAACRRIDGAVQLATLRTHLEDGYAWALGLDFADPQATARFWYVSEEKLEPRLGERHDEPGAELEQPLDVARRAAALHAALRDRDPDESTAAFLSAHPEHRMMVRRVQICARHPYSELCDNLLDAEMRPFDLLRAKLALFGADRFDPRSDRWLRISLFQDQPFPDELAAG